MYTANLLLREGSLVLGYVRKGNELYHGDHCIRNINCKCLQTRCKNYTCTLVVFAKQGMIFKNVSAKSTLMFIF